MAANAVLSNDRDLHFITKRRRSGKVDSASMSGFRLQKIRNLQPLSLVLSTILNLFVPFPDGFSLPMGLPLAA